MFVESDDLLYNRSCLFKVLDIFTSRYDDLAGSEDEKGHFRIFVSKDQTGELLWFVDAICDKGQTLKVYGVS